METETLRREVRRAARGEEDAAALLFDNYYPRVYRYALARLGNSPDAEDVAAETFARVLRDLDRFKWRGAGFEAWLFRIASNLVVDFVRSWVREQSEEAVTEELDRVEERTPETAVIGLETARELGRLLDELGPDQKEVLLLRFAAGLDTKQVARAMRRRPNAVRQLQFRALAKLRDRMGAEVR
ncbi:MAG: sigma-70 family RNA polymerase sigma factor [Actinomycetota bacterium]